MGREEHCKHHWHLWGVLPVSQPHWVCPRSQRVCFPNLHCSGSRLLCQELSEVGPGFSGLPRSKPFRFRFLGTPQRHRLGWACFVPFPGLSSSGDQVLGKYGHCDSPLPPSLLLSFLGVQLVRLLSCAMCLFWGAGLWL